MFIEKLWKENPELVKKAIKKICEIDDDATFGFKRIDENGKIEFINNGSFYLIKVSDFNIDVCVRSKFIDVENLTIRWMKFMKSVFGDKYVYHYIAKRNSEYDEFIAKYNQDFGNKTQRVLEEIGFEYLPLPSKTK